MDVLGVAHVLNFDVAFFSMQDSIVFSVNLILGQITLKRQFNPEARKISLQFTVDL